MDAVPGGSCDNNIRFTRKQVFVIIKTNLYKKWNVVIDHFKQHVLEQNGCSIEVNSEMKVALQKLFHVMRIKWQSVHRKESVFFAKFANWLNTSIAFRVPAATQHRDKGGRPSTEFITSSERTKRRRTEEIRSKFPVEELSYATQMSFRTAGNLDASKLLQEVSQNSSKATEYIKSVESKRERTLSGEVALAYVIEKHLSKSDYMDLRKLAKENNCCLFPSYKIILDCKKKCNPPATDITVSEDTAEVKLQGLLDHSVKRILLLQSSVINSLAEENLRMTLICKWGCDGSSGQGMYKQAFADEDKSDSDIFLSSLVPLQLLSKDGSIVWKNPRPSSPRYCRPIRIQFLHETADATVSEMSYIENQIKDLKPFKIVVEGKEVFVRYDLHLTMIDGKVCNAITHTKSAQRCFLCEATSKEFNNIDMVLNKNINEDHVRFGLSTLHAWIRFFECCLHLSYKVTIKKWQVRSSSKEKQEMEQRKQLIQRGLRRELGLIVDRPKPGFGSTNDGNTARKFFENYEISSRITGVDETLVKRFYIILQVLSSGHEIETEKFHEYAVNTARLFVNLYPWYYMPTSVHKLLIHGSQIIKSAILPIGQMSEDAQESLNKFVKRFREDLSRKYSRVKTMEDVFNRLLLHSDPFLSGIRKLPQKKLRCLSAEAVDLLATPRINKDTNTEEIPEASSEDFESADDDCNEN